MNPSSSSTPLVIPAKAGTQRLFSAHTRHWVPAFAGMTRGEQRDDEGGARDDEGGERGLT